MTPILLLGVFVICLPMILVGLSKFADWLETTRLGDWVRKQERKP